MNDILIVIEKRKGRQSPIITFKEPFNNMERIDQIETLVSIEREVKAKRSNIANDIFQYSKGRW
tara:strand:+ start:334 stop:525 length:192 start_codon:yes stop_codon:yes gene_type:complete